MNTQRAVKYSALAVTLILAAITYVTGIKMAYGVAELMIYVFGVFNHCPIQKYRPNLHSDAFAAAASDDINLDVPSDRPASSLMDVITIGSR